MSNSKTADEERIKAWKAERARIAEADKAARLKQRETDRAQAAEAADQDRKSAALTLISSVQPKTPEDILHSTVGPAPIAATKLNRFKQLGNWQLFCAMVIAPVLCTVFYLFAIATPLYEAQSVIAITKSADAGSGSRSGLLGRLAEALEPARSIPRAFIHQKPGTDGFA